MEDQKKVMFSGTRPSGELHPDNYLGVIKNWGAWADKLNCLYFIVDIHTITVHQTPAELRRRTLEQAAQYIACSLNPEHNTIFVQSRMHQRTELAWVLEYYTMFGELSRMTQFKDKSAKHVDSINAGLFTYPCLIAADILLHQPDFMPVREDQKQHVELIHDMAQRSSHVCGDVLKAPKPYIPKIGTRVMSLSQPDTKMSKSIPEGCVLLTNKPEDILRKFKRAIADSDAERCVRLDRENKSGVSNLVGIYSTVTGRSPEAAETEFDDKGYGVFEPVVGETVAEMLRPIQEETRRLLPDKVYLKGVYHVGVEKAPYVAEKTLRKVYEKVGFLARQ